MGLNPAGFGSGAGTSGATGASGTNGSTGALIPSTASQQWGSSGATRAFPLGPTVAVAAASIALPGVGTMQAWPFILASSGTVDVLRVRSLGAANARVRFGIAQSTGAPLYSVSTVLVDSGDLDASSSAVTSTNAGLNVFLQAGTVYWGLLEPGTAAANFWGVPTTAGYASSIIGVPDTTLSGGHITNLRFARTYGAFPPSFSTYTAAASSDAVPNIYALFSAVG